MDYMTNIYWHTEISEGPRYDDLKKLPVGTAMLLVKYKSDPILYSTLQYIALLPDCVQENDGSWSIRNADDSYTPLKERYSEFQVMAWGEFPIQFETVEQLCDASNRDNYGITERDYKPRDFVNLKELPFSLASEGGLDEIDNDGIDYNSLFKE